MDFDVIIPISSFLNAKTRLRSILSGEEIQQLLLLILDNLIFETYTALELFSPNVNFNIFTPKENKDVLEYNLRNLAESANLSQLDWIFEPDLGEKKDFVYNFNVFIKNFSERTNSNVLIILPCDLILYSRKLYDFIDLDYDINIGNSQDNGTSYILMKNDMITPINFGIQDSFRKNIEEFGKYNRSVHVIENSPYLFDADSKFDLLSIFEILKKNDSKNRFQCSIYRLMKEKFDKYPPSNLGEFGSFKISSKN